MSKSLVVVDYVDDLPPATKLELMQIWRARQIGNEIVKLLKPHCERIEVVGSVLREDKQCKDIDIILIPYLKKSVVQYGMFQNDVIGGYENETKKVMLEMKEIKPIVWGDKKLEFIFKDETIKIEVWNVISPYQWGLAKFIRTGPAIVSKRMAAFALHKHWHIKDLILHMHEKEGRKRPTACKRHLDCKLIADTSTEEKLFNVMGMDYLIPQARNEREMILLEKKALGLSENAKWA